jgi:TRAP-type mannitol/chloroaromatic compound transport system permease small subunit
LRLIDLIIAGIEAVTGFIGRTVAWLVVAMVVITFANVLLRYLYGISVVVMYEAVLYAFAIVLTSLAGWTLKADEHVRVDLFYGAMPPRGKAAVNLAGCVFFLFPLVWFIWSYGQPYVARAWAIREGSPELSGIPYLYVLKSFILVFAATLGLQAVAFLLRALRVLVTGEAPPARAAG